jgi:eukaryotic translation initiation factor 2-alpha kinase 2
MELSVVQYTKDVIVTKPIHLDLIGKGAFGKVYKHYNELDDNTYAVKKILLTQEYANHALKEVRILATLNHPNIVRYFHSWLEALRTSDVNLLKEFEEDQDEDLDSEIIRMNGNQYYMCIRMEYCESNLTNYLQHPDRSKNESYRLQLIRGLAYLHSKGMIHRDLKPDNILISQDIIKITDFGLVKTMEHNVIKNISILNTTYAGTYLYASPEQYQGKPYGLETDIYSLGTIFFEMAHVFLTDMERIQSIQKFHQGLGNKNFTHQEIITQMCSDVRPTIKELEDYFLKENNTIRDLVWEIVFRALNT